MTAGNLPAETNTKNQTPLHQRKSLPPENKEWSTLQRKGLSKERATPTR